MVWDEARVCLHRTLMRCDTVTSPCSRQMSSYSRSTSIALSHTCSARSTSGLVSSVSSVVASAMERLARSAMSSGVSAELSSSSSPWRSILTMSSSRFSCTCIGSSPAMIPISFLRVSAGKARRDSCSVWADGRMKTRAWYGTSFSSPRSIQFCSCRTRAASSSTHRMPRMWLAASSSSRVSIASPSLRSWSSSRCSLSSCARTERDSGPPI
mmetsp:Transcript_30243/g.93319  ORF Transcript_30243/g.93319 Transcript_30243/m.93319 type:complete len:212 (-) Transcript_30243:629-1264(-)